MFEPKNEVIFYVPGLLKIKVKGQKTIRAALAAGVLTAIIILSRSGALVKR